MAEIAAGALGIRWSQPFVGFVAAFAVIWVAWRVAPSHKLVVGTGVLSLGGWIAWQMLEPSMYPESHPKGYQPTHIPFAATVAGGIIALSTRWILAASAKVLRAKDPAATEENDTAS